MGTPTICPQFMLRKTFGAVLLLSSIAAGSAQAQARWLDGTFGFAPGLACVTLNPETEVTTYTGYWGAQDASFPRTGDVSYLHAVAAVVGNPCSGGDVIGFDFFPPQGASVATSAQNPVRCIATRLSDGFTTTTDPNIHCSQTASAGSAGGLFFGYAVVPRGWAFEIQVPVRFDQQLRGIAGTFAEKVKVVTSTTNLQVPTDAWVTVPLRAIVNYPSPSATFTGTVAGNPHYSLTSFVYNYFAAGTAYLDVGTASGSYSNPGITTAPIPGTGNGFSVTNDLGLSPTYTGKIYWRTRFVATSGATFNGPEQSFTANGQSAVTRTLTVTTSGSGQVTSDPQGLSCGATCTTTFTDGTQVTLSAAPGPGSQFTGWSGACSGSGACVVSMTANASVGATFAALPPVTIGSLEIVPSGVPATGIASIAVTGPGGFARTFDIASGLAVAVSDVAVGQYDGVAAAVVVASGTYVPRPARPSTAVLAGGKGTLVTNYVLGRTVTVSKTGAGTGTVTSGPAGLDCGSTCTAWFADGETVTLIAAAAGGATFAGWSGACTGQGSCTLTMTAAMSVVATFNAASPDSGVPDAGASPDSGTGGSADSGTAGAAPTSGGCTSGPGAIPAIAVILLALAAASRARRPGRGPVRRPPDGVN